MKICLYVLFRTNSAHILWRRSEHADNNGVITLIWLQRDLFLWLQFVSLKFLHFGGEYGFRLRSGINTRRFDRNHEVAAILQEILRIECNDTGLIGLCNIGEYSVDHTDEHSVFVWVPGVLDDRDDIRALLGDIDQIATGTV